MINKICTLASMFLKKANTTVIKFRPNEVSDTIGTAIDLYGGDYEYSPEGSTVSFSPKEFYEFVDYLKDAMLSDLFDEDDKNKLQSTIHHIMKQLPES